MSTDDMASDRSDERTTAQTVLQHILDDFWRAGRTLDAWELANLSEAVDAFGASHYRLSIDNAKLALTPATERSHDPQYQKLIPSPTRTLDELRQEFARLSHRG